MHVPAGNEGITAHYTNVALASLPANLSLYDTAHFFAIFECAQFDGRVTYFTMKYNNLFWRPITAAYQLIRQGLQSVIAIAYTFISGNCMVAGV